MQEYLDRVVFFFVICGIEAFVLIWNEIKDPEDNDAYENRDTYIMVITWTFTALGTYIIMANSGYVTPAMIIGGIDGVTLIHSIPVPTSIIDFICIVIGVITGMAIALCYEIARQIKTQGIS